MQSNRRQFHRFSPEPSPCVVTLDSVQMAGVVIDESINGAGICGLDLLMIPFNKRLAVTHRDETFWTLARSVMRRDDGRINLGVVRETEVSSEESDAGSAMLINCYVQLRGALAICAPVELEHNSQILIQLWDGMQFRVKKTQLIPLTRNERFEMLANENILQQAIEMYGFGGQPVDRRKVFEYEFGTFRECPLLQSVN